jgi:hypothetical protein
MFVLLSAEIQDQIGRWNDLKQWERREIGQELRRSGLTYREIASVIPVAKGTLSGWCRDLQLAPAQRARLEAALSRADVQRRSTRRSVGSVLRDRALARAADVRERGHSEAAIHIHDPFWVAGVVAYWAEGAKRHKDLSFSNSDPALVQLFIAWVEKYLGISRADLTAKLHLHSGQDEGERKSYWFAATGIPMGNFRKTYIKPEGTEHRKNVLYNGTISVRVPRSGESLNRLTGWIDAVAEHYALLS